MKRRWRYALLAATVLAVLGVRPGALHVRAASLLVRFTAPDAHGLVADASRYEVESAPLAIDVPGNDHPIRGRLYLPQGIDAPPGVVIAHGVHRTGIDEPRLVRFAETIAATGVAVLTPEIAELCDYRIDLRSVSTIGAAARQLSQKLGRARVGVMGLSFAGGLSVIAAADERWAPSIGFVVSVGGHDDLERVLRFFATDSIPEPDGSTLHMHAHDYGAVVLVYSHVESFFPPADVPEVRAALRAWLWEDFDTARARAKNLDGPSRDKLERIFAHDVASIAPELLAEIAKNRAALAEVSPATYLGRVRAPLYLLHGAGDTVIPAAETLWLAHDAPPGIVHDALVSQAIQHVELHGAPGLLDDLALVHFMSEILRAAEARGP